MSNTDSKVFMIIGKSYSGKDTLLNEILSDKYLCEKYNLHRLVRYTNRRQREGEVDGETYHFITDKDCEKFKYNYEAIMTSYQSKFGLLHYITDLSELESGKNYIGVSDLESIKDYKCLLGERLVVICLIPPNWELFRRFTLRDDVEDQELKYKEIYRRFIDDLDKFSKLNRYIHFCNCIISLNKDDPSYKIKPYIIDFIKNDFECKGIVFNNDEQVEFSNKEAFGYYNDKSFKFVTSGKVELIKTVSVDMDEGTIISINNPNKHIL